MTSRKNSLKKEEAENDFHFVKDTIRWYSRQKFSSSKVKASLWWVAADFLIDTVRKWISVWPIPLSRLNKTQRVSNLELSSMNLIDLTMRNNRTRSKAQIRATSLIFDQALCRRSRTKKKRLSSFFFLVGKIDKLRKKTVRLTFSCYRAKLFRWSKLWNWRLSVEDFLSYRKCASKLRRRLFVLKAIRRRQYSNRRRYKLKVKSFRFNKNKRKSPSTKVNLNLPAPRSRSVLIETFFDSFDVGWKFSQILAFGRINFTGKAKGANVWW